MAGGFATVGVLRRYFAPERRLQRRLAKMPQSTIAGVAEGAFTRLVGRADKLDEVLNAPGTGRACLCYQVIVYEVVQTSDGHEDKERFREVKSVPFVLTDSSGRAIVDPAHSSLALVKDARGPLEVNQRHTAMLARQGMYDRGKILKYTESIIEPGETVAILGSGVREPDPDALPEGGYRGEQPTRLRVTGARAMPLIISDSPKTTR